MLCGKRDQGFAAAEEKRITGDNECNHPLLGNCCERSIKLAFFAVIHNKELQPKRTGSNVQLWCLGLGGGILRIHECADYSRRGHQLVQELYSFCRSTDAKGAMPVMLPPGRFRLGTRPDATGSRSATTNTIGIVAVATLAASAETPPPVAAITAT